MNTAYIDLPILLGDALKQLGCDPKLVTGVDQHSPIVLEFNNAPDIYLSVDESNVWLSTQIPVAYANTIDDKGAVVMKAALAPCAWSQTGSLGGIRGDDDLHFKVSIKEDFLMDPDRFAGVLEEFYGEVKSLKEVLG